MRCRGFENQCITCNENGAELIARSENREIPRRDCQDDSERLAGYDNLLFGCVAEYIGLELIIRIEAYPSKGSGHLSFCVGQWLPVLLNDELRGFGCPRLHRIRERPQHCLPLEPAKSPPSRLCSLRCLQGFVYLSFRAARHRYECLASSWVLHLQRSITIYQQAID